MSTTPPAPPTPSLRIDKLLWFLRLAKSRDLAQDWAEAGHIRVNGRRIERSAAPIRAGDVVTLPQGPRAIAIRVLALPMRRGPAPEAQACYARLDGSLDERLDARAPSRLTDSDHANTVAPAFPGVEAAQGSQDP